MPDAPGGIRLIRQVFGELLPPGYSVTQAYMSYVPAAQAHDVESQVLTFHVIAPDGHAFTVTSDTVPAREDCNELAVRTARRFAEGLKNEPPPASDPKHEGQ